MSDWAVKHAREFVAKIGYPQGALSEGGLDEAELVRAFDDARIAGMRLAIEVCHKVSVDPNLDIEDRSGAFECADAIGRAIGRLK